MSTRDQGNFDLNLQPVEEKAVAPETEEAKHKPDETNLLDCNICLDSAREPVVTLCGHIFCWPCIYRWINQQLSQAKATECPVCKGEVTVKNVIPIYGRGGESKLSDKDSVIPPRPKAPRVESSAQWNNSGSFAFPDHVQQFDTQGQTDEHNNLERWVREYNSSHQRVTANTHLNTSARGARNLENAMLTQLDDELENRYQQLVAQLQYFTEQLTEFPVTEHTAIWNGIHQQQDAQHYTSTQLDTSVQGAHNVSNVVMDNVRNELQNGTQQLTSGHPYLIQQHTQNFQREAIGYPASSMHQLSESYGTQQGSLRSTGSSNGNFEQQLFQPYTTQQESLRSMGNSNGYFEQQPFQPYATQQANLRSTGSSNGNFEQQLFQPYATQHVCLRSTNGNFEQQLFQPYTTQQVSLRSTGSSIGNFEQQLFQPYTTQQASLRSTGSSHGNFGQQVFQPYTTQQVSSNGDFEQQFFQPYTTEQVSSNGNFEQQFFQPYTTQQVGSSGNFEQLFQPYTSQQANWRLSRGWTPFQ